MLEDIGVKIFDEDIPETVRLRLVQVIGEAERRKTQVDYGWKRTLEEFGEWWEVSDISELRESLTALRTDELKNAHIFTPPSPPPKTVESPSRLPLG